MAEKKGFNLVFPENQKKDTNLPTTTALAFDDLGDFIEERERIKREAEKRIETSLRVDYSDFANHVFFDSAVSKFGVAKYRILNQYPFNGTREEKDAFHLTGSDYEDYIFNAWPREVGYVQFVTGSAGDTFISASDPGKKLAIGTGSFGVSVWVYIADEIQFAGDDTTIVSYQSSSGDGWKLNAVDDNSVYFSVTSGSSGISASTSSLPSETWIHLAGVYDKVAEEVQLYVNGNLVESNSFSIGPIELNSATLMIGSGTSGPTLDENWAFTGSVDEVRVFHTASALWVQKNFNRPIDAENYLKLRYTFNEGVFGSASIDSTVVDYSRNGLHGTYVNYIVDTSRVSGSVMDVDPGDPILYSFHPRVSAFTGSQELSGALYDNENNNQIFNLIPETVLREDDNTEGLYRSLLYGMSRFFDELKLYIDQFGNLRITNYDGYNDVPDQMLPLLQRYFGWKVTEHFGDANPMALFFGEDVLASGSLEVPLIDIKNQFWRRVLSNLPYLLKTKGKRYNLDAFFNTLGINRENITLKEYGYLPGTSIQDTRLHKQKVTSMLGIGVDSETSISGTVVYLGGGPFVDLAPEHTTEILYQPPYVSASYDQYLLTGSICGFAGAAGRFSLGFIRDSLTSDQGRFFLSSSATSNNIFTSSLVDFDGSRYHIAFGVRTGSAPDSQAWIDVRRIDGDEIDLELRSSSSFSFNILSTGSANYSPGVGGAFIPTGSQGYFGEFRHWNRELSGSELEDHALHFESVGIANPQEEPHPLQVHWALNEDETADGSGLLPSITDLSRNGRDADTFLAFDVDVNPYEKFFLDYNYLSPSIDLKWSENKIRIRNKTELTIDDVASDTNEVSLEFNLVESLNEDITKIFSTFDIVNNIIGKPINKYRDEYADLEAIRREYFERLGDSIHFTQFFKLFKWFDRKLSDSIKQLLPARVKFVGGEQVVESHFLERSKYGYKYPIFRTPQDLPEAVLRGTYAEGLRDADPLYKGYSSASFSLFSDPGDSVVVEEAAKMLTIPNSPPVTLRNASSEGRPPIILTEEVFLESVETPARVQYKGVGDVRSTTDVAVTLDSSPVAGNTLVLMSYESSTSITSITQAGVINWTEVWKGADLSIWVATDIPDGAGAAITASYADQFNNKSFGVFEYSGVDPDPVTASGSATGSGSAGDTGVVGSTSQTAASVLLALNQVAPTQTIPGNHTEAEEWNDGGNLFATYDKILTEPDPTHNGTVSYDDSGPWELGIVVLKGTENRTTVRRTISPSESPITLDVEKIAGTPTSLFWDGVNEKQINPPADLVYITRSKVTGDTPTDINDPNSGVNFRNEYAREVVMRRDRDNES